MKNNQSKSYFNVSVCMHVIGIPYNKIKLGCKMKINFSSKIWVISFSRSDKNPFFDPLDLHCA
jgi:hypothetical protein